MKVHLSCPMCSETADIEVETPEGWASSSEQIDEDEDFFCPKHAGVAAFLQDQCPGCVAGFPDCPLTESYAYSPERTITEEDFNVMEHEGRCLRRVNGTFMTDSGPEGTTVTQVDLSRRSEAGAAMAGAIRDYIRRWPG